MSDKRDVAKTLATLGALALMLPINVVVVGLCFAIDAVRGSGRYKKSRLWSGKTVLISGGKMTKALQLARSFRAAGHRVVLVENERYWFAAHRVSNAVDRFHVLPAPDAPNYVEALLAVIASEDVNVYVPVTSPIGSLYDSLAMPRLAAACEVVHVSPDMIEELDDKYAFATTAARLGLAAPKSVRVTCLEDVLAFDFAAERRPFILKSIRYDPIRRLDLTRLPLATAAATEAYVRSLPIAPDNPWVMQEFISGTEYCTHGTFRDGELRMHCCCLSSPFQINYEHVDKPEVEAWVRRFGAGLGLTGQASFDFIEADDDRLLYAIECNPRTHSAVTMFYNHPHVAAAYLGGALPHTPIRPLASSRPTYWLYYEIWRLLRALPSPRAAAVRLRLIATGKDAVLDRHDPLPFFMLHHWHVPLLLLRSLREGRGWFRIDLNIGKLVQAGGD